MSLRYPIAALSKREEWKIMKFKVAIAVFSGIVSSACFADGDFSVGLSAANLKYDQGTGNVTGVNVAYSLNKHVYFELSHSSGSLESCPQSYCDNYDYTTTGAYAVVRTSGNVYALVKGGMVAVKADDDRVNESSIGFGGGIEFSKNVHVEVEYVEKELSLKHTAFVLRYWF